MYLIERYIMVEIRRLVMIIASFLIFIFASYSAQRYLTDAANGTLALGIVADVVFYKSLIALEMILPVALYVSVAVALGQLYSDTEITAMQASGASPLLLYKAVLVLAIPLAIGVTLLSMYGRPWAYANIYQLRQQSQSLVDISHLQAGKFNVGDNGRMVLASKIDKAANHLSDVLIYLRSEKHTNLYSAASVKVISTSPSSPTVRLKKGTSYVLDRQGSDDSWQDYDNFDVSLKPIVQSVESKHKSSPLAVLANSGDPGDRAELQWRYSRGLITVLMVLLAIPLSRTEPRQGRYATLLPLTVLFVAIFYGGNICRTLVANGALPVTPGIWLVPIVMSIWILFLLAHDLSLLPKKTR
ncbi:LPS export ABC transporter permease LptF [Dryocola clanedunensis]|uniref:LPS export ABC transporter permease LptF n=1 Tax=Cedecea sulfonylureivorans TaxID=3051154 RepID=UPI001927AB68|nr:LPS export ABC transporter permease LptF [Cedecea sulfonylureivorans]